MHELKARHRELMRAIKGISADVPRQADLRRWFDEVLARRKTVRGSPVPYPSRSHDVSGLTAAELERTRRDLQASLALARPGSAACVPILAHLSTIDAALARRSAG